MINIYRALFETMRELTRLRAKYERHETDAARVERYARWVYDATMAAGEPLATGAIVSGPADVEALTAGCQPDV